MSTHDENVDVDPTDGRNETLTQRMDRNWLEILQELRVVQAGTQILTGFLLAVAFQPRFATLDTFQRVVYLVLITTSALTTAAGLAPVTLHRALFRRHAKELLVNSANTMLKIVLLGVGVMLTGVLLLIFDVTVGRVAGIIAGSATVVILVAIGLFPMVVSRSRRGSESTRHEKAQGGKSSFRQGL